MIILVLGVDRFGAWREAGSVPVAGGSSHGGIGMMSERDALIYRDVLQWQAVACARADLMIQAAIWVMAADMCRAAAWTAQYGATAAEQLVRAHCQGE